MAGASSASGDDISAPAHASGASALRARHWFGLVGRLTVARHSLINGQGEGYRAPCKPLVVPKC